jgi:hypothetical protein
MFSSEAGVQHRRLMRQSDGSRRRLDMDLLAASCHSLAA